MERQEVESERISRNSVAVKKTRVEEDHALVAGGAYRLLSFVAALVALVGASLGHDGALIAGAALYIGFTICAELCRIAFRLGDGGPR